MTATRIATEHAPAAVGPYSQAVEAGGTVYVSGQVPLVPATGQLVDGGIQMRAGLNWTSMRNAPKRTVRMRTSLRAS